MEYGLQQCSAALTKLASSENFEERIANAFYEIDCIEHEDVSKKHYNQLFEWKRKYELVVTLTASNSDELCENDSTEKLKKLSTEIVEICLEIIDYHAKRK